MSMDHVIKVWDLRTNKCIQTLTTSDWPRPHDALAQTIIYDAARKRLITSAKKPFVWEHKLIMRDRTGHQSPCIKALYNSAFFVVVTADESAVLPG
jgi:WD40 repeat protein